MKPEILSVALVGNAFPRAADDGNAPECRATPNAKAAREQSRWRQRRAALYRSHIRVSWPRHWNDSGRFVVFTASIQAAMEAVLDVWS